MTTANPALKTPDLWLMRLYYFLYYAGNAIIMPFLNVYLTERGMSGTQVGIVAAVSAAITLVAAPLWTRRSEQSRHPRELLQLALVLSSVGCLALGYQDYFVGILVVSAFRAVVGAGVFPLSDAVALSVAKLTQAGYGSVRVWGSVGWMVMGFFSGRIIEELGWLALLGSAGLMYLLTAATLIFLGQAAFENEEIVGQARPVTRDLMQRILQQPLMLGVGAMMIFTVVLNTGVLQFESVFLTDLGATKSIIGLVSILGALVELPFMVWADKIIGRRGTYAVMMMAMALYVGVRLLVLIIPSVPTIMIARAVGGIGFSFFTIPLTIFFGEQVAQQERRTVMALYNVTLVSLIGIIVPPFAGAIYDAVGGRWLYALSALGYLLGGLSLYYAWQHRGKRTPV